MSFLAGLTRSSAQFICDRSLATLSSRIALPMVAKTAVVTANVRRNWTQTPEQLPANTKVWRDITAAMDKANVLSHRRDTTPDQAWERRSVFKLARLQHVPLPGPSTGRTVYITQRQSFAMALNRLDQIIRTNHVRRELMESRFFTKGHVRRHKLNAIRWRRRFAQMVREKVQIVQGIRKRGM